MTAPRWIAEALDEALNASDDAIGRVDYDAIVSALIERLPIEAMGRENSLTGLIRVLTDGDPEVVELTELYQGACKALDSAGVPYAVDVEVQPHLVIESTIGELEPRKAVEVSHVPAHHAQVQVQLDLVGRIRWLAQQRPIRAELDSAQATRKLAEEMATKYMADRNAAQQRANFKLAEEMATKYMADRNAAQQRANFMRIEREHFRQLSEDLQASLNDMSKVARQLEIERDLARAMHQDAERAFADAKRGDR